ncbi:MAG: peptidase MA family metallohydrolase [Syntrophales bacterium]|jgi:hypothetical protein
MEPYVLEKLKSIFREENPSSYIGEDDNANLSMGGVTVHCHIKDFDVEQVFQVMSGEDDTGWITKGNITVRCHIKGLDVAQVFRTICRTQHILSNRYQHVLENVDIFLHDSLEELRQVGHDYSKHADWIAGIFDGRQVHIVSTRDDGRQNGLYVLLTHELIHLAVCEMSGGKCPYWLDEGLAVHLSQNLPEAYRNTLQMALLTDSILPLEVLETPLPPRTRARERLLAYGQVAAVAAYLVNRYGEQEIGSMIRLFGQDSITNVMAHYELNYTLLKQKWKRYLTTGGVLARKGRV